MDTLVHAGDAPMLDAGCFDDLEQAPAAPSERPPFDRPPAVLELATDAWNQGKLSELPHLSRYEQRAWHRAALLCLAATHPVATFPPQLQGQRARSFRSDWWSSEGGRGLRDVLKVFGVLPSDERARAWVIEMG
jgi:hypothetical protein